MHPAWPSREFAMCSNSLSSNSLPSTSLGLWTSAPVIAVLLGLAGCGGQAVYPVHGKVTWEDGSQASELAGGLVICESVEGQVGARGDIEKDGSFQLST